MQKSQKKPNFITNVVKRKVTLSKRRRGLFKKAMELSYLCGVDIFMVVFDSNKQKLFELNSQKDFDIDVVSHILEKVNRQQFVTCSFTNDDYDAFVLDKPENSNKQLSDSNNDSDDE